MSKNGKKSKRRGLRLLLAAGAAAFGYYALSHSGEENRGENCAEDAGKAEAAEEKEAEPEEERGHLVIDESARIDYDALPRLSDEEWAAIGALLPCIGMDKDVGIAPHSGGRMGLWDKEEDRPLSQEDTLRLLAGKVEKPLSEYEQLTPEQRALLENLLGRYGCGARQD